ncbi:hypothetical protein DPMN_113636 [Dreissena polymorpha]|uniref:Uncharacterized protein n=1 Tax=Dreissena polymorpha TaxID=45954 RepID=A0A9D4KJE8_DREPO|nr:hypothetical protein DPMN_113636 [Dreissena polymorpha]
MIKINVLKKTLVLSNFQEDRTIHVDIIRRTKYEKKAATAAAEVVEYCTINVASRVLTRKNDPPPVGHVFQPTGIIFELVQDIIGMNLLTKFHEDRTVNVASRVLTIFYYSHVRKNAPPLGSHVFQANIIIFKLIQDIIETNLLTKFHEDWKQMWPLEVLTRKNAPPPGGHVFIASKTIFELIQDIVGTNLLTKFRDDRKINVTSRKIPRPRGDHVFKPTGIIFELLQDIIGMNLLTEFHEDRTINVASRVKKICPNDILDEFKNGNLCLKKIMPVIFPYKAIFRDDRKINVTSRKIPRPRGGHVFQPTGIIFELLQDIIGINLLTKFHEDRKINVASRVLTRKYRENCLAPWRPYINKQMNTATPPGGHVFQRTGTIF